MYTGCLAMVMSKFVVCSECKAEHRLEDILQERKVRDNLDEIGLYCTCGLWTHSFFTDAALKKQAALLAELLANYQSHSTPALWKKYETARNVYNRQFVAFNRRWRRKFGMLR